MDKDRASAVGVGEPEVVFHVERRQVTKEEYLWIHKDWENQRKERNEREDENMNNKRDPEDHEELVGDKHHNDSEPPHDETVSILQFPI